MNAIPLPQRRIATYERVSSEDQRQRETIKTQTEEIARRLAANPEVIFVDRYADDGISGTIPMAQRPDGARLFRDAALGLFEELWVYSVDRLGRGWVDPEIVWEELERLGVKIYSVSEDVSDRLIYHIMAGIAAKKRVDFLKVSHDGMRRAAKEGRYCGGIVPYGYRVEGTKQHARLVPAEEEIAGGLMSAADVVRFIYARLAVDGLSCRRIATELTALGIPTKYTLDGRGVRGKRTQGRWGAGRIRNLVTNPVYRGELQYGRRAEPKPNTPREPVISAAVPALVSASVWWAAQETLARNRSLPKNTRRIYLLRGVLRCARCGRAFCGTTTHGETWYRCDGALRRADLHGDRCEAKGIKGGALEPQVWADIEAWLANQANLVRELEAEAASHPARRALEEERARWATALVERDAQRERVLDLYQTGYLARLEFEERLAAVETARREILDHIERLTDEDAVVDEEALPADLLAELRRRLEAGLSDEDRQEIVRLLVRRITVHTTIEDDGKKTQRAVIEYRFGGGETHTGTDS